MDPKALWVEAEDLVDVTVTMEREIHTAVTLVWLDKMDMVAVVGPVELRSAKMNQDIMGKSIQVPVEVTEL